MNANPEFVFVLEVSIGEAFDALVSCLSYFGYFLTSQDFFKSSNPADVVTKYNKITFKSPASAELLNSEYTTDEIRSLCDDLKVSNHLFSLVQFCDFVS